MPFYLLAPAAVLPFVRAQKLKIACVLVPALAFPLSFNHYTALTYAAVERAHSIEVTRIAPRRWIAEQVRPGARVGYYAQGQVTLPQIWDMPYNFSTELFNFPYLDADKMRQSGHQASLNWRHVTMCSCQVIVASGFTITSFNAMALRIVGRNGPTS